MMRPTDIITIFYSSASDVGRFDRLAVFRRAVEDLEQMKGVMLKIFHWQHNIPGGIGCDSAQGVIDNTVDGNYDIYFGCLGIKFGPGTVNEYEKAIKTYIKDGDPKHLFFSFDETPVNPYSIDIDSLKLIKDFRSNIGSSSKYGRAMLYFTFHSEEEFRKKVLLNISDAIEKIQTRVRGGIKFK